MALFRTLIGVALLICAAVIAWLGLVYNNYKEEYASPPLHTFEWAIPWTVATAVLGVLVLGSLFDRNRRDRWSWLALALAAVMGVGMALLIAF